MADPGMVDEAGIIHRVDVFTMPTAISVWKIDIVHSEIRFVYNICVTS